jgi:hypothetical protein
VPIILIPLIWLAVATLVVAACQVASCADGGPPGPTVRQELLDEPTFRDQWQTPERSVVSQTLCDGRRA